MKRSAETTLTGKTVVITGASSGAGRAASLEFAKYRCNLVLAARNTLALSELAEECRTLGAQPLVVPTDVTDNSEVVALAAAAAGLDGKIDVWINNAGVLAAGDFDRTPVEVHEHVIRTNLIGYIYGAHAALPYFKKQGYGVLINNISIGGYLPVPFAVGYSASKFGLRGFSAALKGELYGWPEIHVCDLYPAFLDTPGIQHAANYTGKQLRPAPPVYDPRRVAMAMVSVAKDPTGSRLIGSVAGLLKVAHTLFPGVTRRILSSVMTAYFNRAEPIAATSGNVFSPLKYGTSIHGGWGLPGTPKAHRKYIAAGVLIAGAAAAVLLAGGRRK